MRRKELAIFLLLVSIVLVDIAVEYVQYLRRPVPEGETKQPFSPGIISQGNLDNLAGRVGRFGIFSIGLGIVIITGGIELSVGSIFALQGVLMCMLIEDHHWHWAWAVAACMVGTTCLGALHGFLITRVRIQPFVVTLCGLLIYRGLARWVSNDQPKGLQFGVHYGFTLLGREFLITDLAKGKLFSVPMPFVLLVIIGAIMWVVLHRSVYGRHLLAVGRNEDAARYAGINSRRVIATAYIICGFLTAVSGLLFVLDDNSVQGSTYGNFYEFYGIAAAVLGGCSLRGGEGSILGIIMGAAVIRVLLNVVNLLGIPSELEFAVVGAAIFVGVLVDQLLAQRRAAKA